MCQSKTEEKFTMISSRSTSPMPDIQRSLFKDSKPPVVSCRKRSSRRRPSLEDELQKFASPEADKENEGCSSAKLSCSRLEASPSATKLSFSHQRYSPRDSRPSCSRQGLSPRDTNLSSSHQGPSPRESNLSSFRQGPSPRGTNVFRFSSSQLECPLVPRLQVQQCEDDVFSDLPCSGPVPPASSRLLLTPSTSHTPLYLGTSSPLLTQGLCCSTPNRLRLEKEGLDRVVDKMVLGRGAYGTVVLGQWRGRKVAVKVMEREEGGKSARRRRSLESELQAAKLDHEHVVRVYGVHAQDDRHAVIVMEYVGSRNLHRLLVEQREKPLGQSWLLTAAHQISSGLAHCHSRKVVHLDIKPANVMVTSSGICKLGDFGCSASMEPGSKLPAYQGLVGTPGYQAPELLKGGLPSLACDIYSLGILLWQLDSRSIPFSGQHPQTVMFRVVSAGARPPVPSRGSISIAAFTSTFQICWSADPLQRPTAKQVVGRLEGVKEAVGGPRRVKGQLLVKSMR